MKKIFLSIFIASVFSITPKIATADLLSVWVRGDGIFLKGDTTLDYFSENTLGPGYGFAVGAEVLFIDFMLDANFFPDGAQFNQIGLGFDADLLPVPEIHVSPTSQIFYTFGKFDVDRESIKAIHVRAGLQVGVNFAKYFWFNLEGYTGYLLTTPDVGAGFVFSGGANLTAKLDIWELFFPEEKTEKKEKPLKSEPYPAVQKTTKTAPKTTVKTKSNPPAISEKTNNDETSTP